MEEHWIETQRVWMDNCALEAANWLDGLRAPPHHSMNAREKVFGFLFNETWICFWSITVSCWQWQSSRTHSRRIAVHVEAIQKSETYTFSHLNLEAWSHCCKPPHALQKLVEGQLKISNVGIHSGHESKMESQERSSHNFFQSNI
jgi:hypothetical protein